MIIGPIRFSLATVNFLEDGRIELQIELDIGTRLSLRLPQDEVRVDVRLLRAVHPPSAFVNNAAFAERRRLPFADHVFLSERELELQHSRKRDRSKSKLASLSSDSVDMFDLRLGPACGWCRKAHLPEDGVGLAHSPRIRG